MLAGLITPPLIMSTQLGFDSQTQNQMVAGKSFLHDLTIAASHTSMQSV